MELTREDLISFADEIAEDFNAGKIKYPIHLSDGNENQLIKVFKTIRDTDWVCGSWRMHSQCLLHGVPRDELKKAIYAGSSMTLCFPAYNIVSSAIVGGILPIALGIALKLKMGGENDQVHCWLGDMTAEGGMFHECREFAFFHELPIRWIIEDNEISVCTPTRKVWGGTNWRVFEDVTYYQCKSKYPHAGAGVRVQF